MEEKKNLSLGLLLNERIASERRSSKHLPSKQAIIDSNFISIIFNYGIPSSSFGQAVRRLPVKQPRPRRP